MNPELSIIVTSYKSPTISKLCIKTIQETLKDIEYEIILSDSATEQTTEEVIKKHFPNIAFIPHKTNTGLSILINDGLKKAKGKYLLLLNNDIIILPGSIETLIQYLENNPKVGLVAPQLLNFDSSPQDSCFRPYSMSTIIYRRTLLGKTPQGKKKLADFLMKDYDRKEPRKVDWLMGSAYLTTREAVDKVGPWDQENFFMYFEDVDWCRRFWDNNYEVVYHPQAKMYHYHGQQSARQKGALAILSNKSARAHLKSAYKYFLKYKSKNPFPKTFQKNNDK